MFLTPEEIEELTGKVRRPAQIRALRFMGIEHKIRADGAPIVLRAHIEKSFDGITETVKRKDHLEPNWNAIA
ncbi:MAG: DUF4224 domain-containing protein [Alphaproteobacteria bacterium]|nr:DUF4224 domain-containing protein [Alphaproteobacteria bacterium]